MNDILVTNLEQFVENAETIIDYDELTDVVNDAFTNNYKCKCTYGGSDDYFDKGMMQWYPGDPPEYEIDGYEDYVDEVVDYLASVFKLHFKYDIIDVEVKKFIETNINDLTDNMLLDIEDFEEKAVEDFIRSYDPYDDY